MRKSNLVDHTGLRVDLEVLVKLGAPRLLILCSQSEYSFYRNYEGKALRDKGFRERTNVTATFSGN